MTDLHLLDNATAGWEPFALSGTGQTIATNWHSTSAGFVNGFRWRRLHSATLPAPSVVALWDNDGSLIHSEAVTDPGGSVDEWIDIPLSSPIATLADHEYQIGGFWADGHSRPMATSGQGTPPSPLAFRSSVPFTFANGSSAGASSTQLDFVPAVDVAWSTTSSGGGGGTTDGDLAAWLSANSSTNTHHDDLPWRTDANITTLKGEAEGVNGFAAIKAVADAVAAAVSGLPGTIAGAVTTITGQLTTMTGNITQTGIATIGSISHDVTALLGHTEDTAVDVLRLLTGTGDFPGDEGEETWVMIAENDVVGALAWAQPANLYVLSITVPPHGAPLNLVDGVHTFYRAGWWTPLNGSFGRQRRFIDFEDNHLELGGELMPGVLIALQPDGEAHVEAWVLG